MPSDPRTVSKRLDYYLQQIQADARTFIGFPAATDFIYDELRPFFGYLLNNIGDPYKAPLHTNHSKYFEQEVITFFADLFRAPVDDRWGYVTNGGTESNLYALYVARELYPTARVYYSSAAHYSHPKNIHLLNMEYSTVRARTDGEMDYTDLRRTVAQYKDRPAIVVATIGTTMTEARDNVTSIKKALQQAGVARSFIHSDGALAGAYAPYLEPHWPFDFADGADSVSISGHKFIGCPMASGVIIIRKSHRDRVMRSGVYTGSWDTTISGSRNGHTPLMLWYAIQRWGNAGFKQRALDGIRLAAYTTAKLQEVGWKAWRHPYALTVVMAAPSAQLVTKWQLATHEGWSHVICMPGVTKERIDDFIADVAAYVPHTKPVRL